MPEVGDPHSNMAADAMILHQRIPCPLCGAIFVKEDVMQEHFKKCNQKLVCYLCQKRFYDKPTLKRHMKKVHPEAV